MLDKEIVKILSDAVGDLTVECCNRCEENESTEACAECFVKSTSDRAFAVATDFGVYWSPMRYEIRKYGSPWPNHRIEDDEF